MTLPTPARGHIIAKEHEAKDVTEGGIVLPENAQEKPRTATVLSVGKPEDTDYPMEVDEGATVHFSNYGGVKITVGGDEFLVLKSNDILAFEKGA